MDPWHRRGAVAWLLWPASLAFALVAGLRRMLFRMGVLKSSHPGIPVVVVGNVTVGGSGKTPLVLWIAQFLRANGWSPGIVSRGYGGGGSAPQAATIASEAAQVGDEPIVLSRRSGCPVWVGADRVAAAAALRAAHREVDILILDDGLQHYAIRRDLEIAVLDSRGLGNGRYLPAGPLREGPGRLKSVDAVVGNGLSWPGAFGMKLEGEVLHRMTDAGDRRPASAFAGQSVHGVAGIGDPNRFFLHLRALGLRVVPHPFPDHHPFTAQDLARAVASQPELPVVMTEKDAVKLRRVAQPHWWVLPVTARPDAAFGEWLLRRANEWRRPQAA